MPELLGLVLKYGLGTVAAVIIFWLFISLIQQLMDLTKVQRKAIDSRDDTIVELSRVIQNNTNAMVEFGNIVKLLEDRLSTSNDIMERHDKRSEKIDEKVTKVITIMEMKER